MILKKLLEILKVIISVFFREETEEAVAPILPVAAVQPQQAVQVQAAGAILPFQDMKLTPNFGLGELTQTDNAALQAKNRMLTTDQVNKLREVAQLMEQVRALIAAPIHTHSGYRCPELNGVTPGSATHSQHMLAEACDFSVLGAPDSADAVEGPFQKIWQAARAGQLKFGQLIVENAQRSYGKVFWIHISLGQPHRDPALCGQVLRMVADATGKPVYTMIGKV